MKTEPPAGQSSTAAASTMQLGKTTSASAQQFSSSSAANAAIVGGGPAVVSPYTGRQMSRQLLEEFMVAYRNNPCLWKIKCKDYLNKDLKVEAYKQLVQICRKEHRTAGREFVVKKINSLRGSFRREYKRVISEENYVPQLWFYELMQFTADQETADELNGYGAVGGGSAAMYAVGGGYEFGAYGDEHMKDKLKSEDDDNSNSNLSYQILQAYDPNDEYAHCLENDAVEQELIINSTNPMVDGNGQEAAAASAAAISESTSIGVDYIANSLNIQHHETCPSVSDVMDTVEENIIEPDVILPPLMCDVDEVSSPESPPPAATDLSNSASPMMHHNSTSTTSYTNGAAGSCLVSATLSSQQQQSHSRGPNVHSQRSRRSLRRHQNLHHNHNNNNNHHSNLNHNNNNNCDTKPGAYDEYMAFGVTVAAKLSRMDTFQRLYAENIINQTLFKGMLNQLQAPADDFLFNPAAAIKRESSSS